MKNMTLGNIAEACSGTYHGAEEAKERRLQTLPLIVGRQEKAACL